MAATISRDQLLLGLRESGVVEESNLGSFLEKCDKDAPAQDAEQLAEAMLKSGLITRFQKDMLLQGKRRGYIIADKYILLDHIGAGGMGSVYLCQHKIMQRRVAIKVLPTAFAKDPEYLQRFHREARAAAALDHLNIVRAFDVDHDEKIHFLVMEYVDGSSLQDLVSKEGPLDCRRAADYISQAASGLQHAHEAGLVHRDIKPGNLLVDRKGTVKVLDMGLALFFQEQGKSLTQQYDANAVLGTAEYLAPEQAVDSHGVDIRADIYSLGLTLFFLLTGKSPYGEEGTLAQKLLWHQMRKAKSVREFRPDVPEGLADVVAKMLEKDREQRYQTPQEVVDALTPWVKGGADTPTRTTKVSPGRKTSINETVVDADTKASNRTRKKSLSDSNATRIKKKSEQVDILEEVTDDNQKSRGPRSSGKHRRKPVKKSVWSRPEVLIGTIGGAVLLVVLVVVLILMRSGSTTPGTPVDNTVVAAPPPVQPAKQEPPPVEVKPVIPIVEPKVEPPKNDPPKVEPNVDPPKQDPPKQVDPPVDKPKKNPPKTKTPPPPAKESWADYVPKLGDVAYYDVATYVPIDKSKKLQGQIVRMRWDFKSPKDVKELKAFKDFTEDNAIAIDSVFLRVGTIEGAMLKGGNMYWTGNASVKSQALFRTTPTHTEFAEYNAKTKELFWEPILPLIGEDKQTWKLNFKSGDAKQYTVTKVDKSKNTITIRTTMPNPPNGDLVSVITYAKGKGEINRTDSLQKSNGGTQLLAEKKLINLLRDNVSIHSETD